MAYANIQQGSLVVGSPRRCIIDIWLSLEAAVLLHCFVWSSAVIAQCVQFITRCNSVIMRCDCSSFLCVKQCSYRAMYHSYCEMREIYHGIWSTSCTMWSSPILKKKMAYHSKLATTVMLFMITSILQIHMPYKCQTFYNLLHLRSQK